MVGNGLLLVVAFVWLGRGPGVRTAGRAAAVPCGGAALAAVGSAGQRVDALPVRLGCSYDSAARLEEPAGRLRLVLDAGLADARRDQLAGAARRRAWPPRTATVRGDRLYSRWRLALT